MRSRCLDALSARCDNLPLMVESLKDADPRYRDTLIQMMRSQAYRELAAAHLFGHGLQFVTDLKTLKFLSHHIQEETEHYRIVADLHQEHVGESLVPWVEQRLREKPIPMSSDLMELAIAQWLYDRGGFWQLQEYEESSWAPYREAVTRIIGQEKGHQDHGESIAIPLCREAKDRAKTQEIYNRWLKLGLVCLGRPHSEGNTYAISVGLKKRDSAECIKDYVADILPGTRAAGLTLPPRDSLGVDLPEDIDWPTD